MKTEHEQKQRGICPKLKQIECNWKSLQEIKMKYRIENYNNYNNNKQKKNKLKKQQKKENKFFLPKNKHKKQHHNFLDYKKLPYFYISYFYDNLAITFTGKQVVL